MAQASIIRLRLPGLRAREPESQEKREPRGPSVMALSHLPRGDSFSPSAHYSGLDAPPRLLLRARQAAVNLGDHLGSRTDERVGRSCNLCSIVPGVADIPG